MIPIKGNDYRGKQYGRLILQIIFLFSLVSYLGFYLIELLSPDLIERFYNLNAHLIVVIITGILALLFSPRNDSESEKIRFIPKIWDYIIAIVLTVIVAVIFWLKLNDLGWVSYLISFLVAIIIISLSTLTIRD